MPHRSGRLGFRRRVEDAEFDADLPGVGVVKVAEHIQSLPPGRTG
jgi:hypothetical protein